MWVEEPVGRWVSVQWRDGGLCANRSSKYDIIEVPKRIQGWVNVYKLSEGGFYFGGIWEIKEQADIGDAPDRIACIPVDFEEGEGL